MEDPNPENFNMINSEPGVAPTTESNAPHNLESEVLAAPNTGVPPTPERTASTLDSRAPAKSEPNASVSPIPESSAPAPLDVNDKTSENQKQTSLPTVLEPNATEKNVPPASKSPPLGPTTVHDVLKQPDNRATAGHPELSLIDFN
ncbi:Uncharacterized protein Adt_41353 [Abeliophyllum distichum]|uniref:Uncharacterized protein n=1 Tax=Abeliophyllum distichum TaxID=126358 RepID=A0ABD1PPE9_9LAMI